MKKILLASCFFVSSWCSVPRYTTPVGIPNEHGCCYAIAALQLFQAVHFACPEIINPLIVDPEYKLLYSYGTMLNKITYWSRSKRRGFADKMPAFDATNFFYQFAQQNPKRNQHIIVEKRTDNQGATQELSIGDWESDLKGGYVSEVTDPLLTEVNEATVKHNLGNLLAPYSYKQFTGALSIDADEKQLLDLHKLDPALKEAPRFLVTYCNKFKSFLPVTSVQVKTEENTQRSVEYTLLAITYHTPEFNPENGNFDSNHVFTVARYGNRWYLCDGHVITPFPSTASCLEWMQHAAEISYSGPGLPAHACTAVTPGTLIYERIETENK